MTCLHALNLIPPVRRHETLASTVLVAGMTFGVAVSSALALESAYGKAGPTPILHWSTILGAVVGGIGCLVEMTEAVYRDLPEDVKRRLPFTIGEGAEAVRPIEFWVCVLAPFLGVYLGLWAVYRGRPAAGNAMLFICVVVWAVMLGVGGPVVVVVEQLLRR